MNLIEKMKAGQKIAIGMIHSLPLPGSCRYGGDMEYICQRAVQDALALEKEGFDAAIIENTCDSPTGIKLDVPQIAALSAVAARVRQAVSIPLGIEAVFNDYAAALSVAIVCGAEFIRLPVFVDTVITASGIIDPCSRDAVLLRKSLGAEHVKIFADIHSKHSHLLNPEITLTESAAWAELRGADAIIVTGQATGLQTSAEAMEQVRRAVKLPVLAGSGVTADNVNRQLSAADGVIVGSSLKQGGNLTEPIDPLLARHFMAAVRGRKVKMDFRAVYYIVMGYPSLEKTKEMVDRYVEHGVRAIQLDMPSRDPYGESPFIQTRMAQALSQYPDYESYMQALREIRLKHPDLEVHLVVYPDVIREIGLERFTAFCREVGTYTVLGAKDPASLTYMNEHGVTTSSFINCDCPDSAIELAKRNDQQIVMLRNQREDMEPVPGRATVEDRVRYVREKGVRAPLFAVAGIHSKEMLEQAREAGADGAYVGTVLMKLWDDEEALWKKLEEFQSVTEKR